MNILVVDDEKDFRNLLTEIISNSGYQIDSAPDGKTALEMVQKKDYDVALIDFIMPKMDGRDLMREIKRVNNETAVIFITGHGSLESAEDAIKQGAYDYITKPVQFEGLENLLKRLFETRSLIAENRQLKKVLRQKYSFENIIGNSHSMMKVAKLIEFASQSFEPVYIEGENGTGKGLVAKTIHFNSCRASKPFISHDCSALNSEMLIDEWLGSEAVNKEEKNYLKRSIFRLAHKGTIFLNEICTLSKRSQEVLLQIINSKLIFPQQGNRTDPVDIRIVVSNSGNLQEYVIKGLFDPNLYDALCSIRIDLCPLLERREDIPVLVEHFLKLYDKKGSISMLPETINILQKYNWPENVWELENVIKNLSVCRKSEMILPEDLPDHILKSCDRKSTFKYKNLKPISLIEKEAILRTLHSYDWDIVQATKVLQISSSTLYRKIKKYNLRKSAED